MRRRAAWKSKGVGSDAAAEQVPTKNRRKRARGQFVFDLPEAPVHDGLKLGSTQLRLP